MRYWLFKTEPDSYSIDDLANEARGFTPWEGIRNYQARNILRDEVQRDDRVLIYHSSCKPLGIAGIARVVRPAYPDPFQFDPSSQYFDPKSRADNPRWVCVDIAFDRKFDPLLSRTLLANDPRLANMVLFKQGRLSVQPVTPQQFNAICALAKQSS